MSTTKRASRSGEPAIDRLGRETFIHAYLLAGRFTAEVEEVCREEQLTMSHYTVLWFLRLRQGPDGLPMGALADGHLNRASDLTRLADRLTKLGYMERFASEEDRRVVLARITPAGRDVFVRLTEKIRALHRRQWSNLTESELQRLAELLAKALWGDAAAEAWKHPLMAGPGEAGAQGDAAAASRAGRLSSRRRKASA